MKHPFVTSIAVILITVLFAFMELWETEGRAESLQASDDLSWYRGNLHTHSHWSDGDDYLEMIARWYRQHDYQFLVFTDHNVLAGTERWINVEKSKGGSAAYGKLKVTFPKFVRERITPAGELEVRLRTFQEVTQQLSEPEKFLLIRGEEISDSFESLPIHLCVGNVAELIPPMTGTSVYDTLQNNVRAVIIQRERTGQAMMVHINHPNFGYAVTAEDMMRVRGEQFFEVYNGHPAVANSGDALHAGMDRVWDILLTHRLAELQLPVMYGLAVDDGHDYHVMATHQSNPGRGWVMVLAPDLSAESLIHAMEAGRFYASSGVNLTSIKTTEQAMVIEVAPVDGETYVTEFIGTRKGYDATSQPVTDSEGKELRVTRHYSSDIGETLAIVAGNRAEYRFEGDEIYVRARITSSAAQPNPGEADDPKRAWCQPILGPSLDHRQVSTAGTKSETTTGDKQK